MSLDLHSGRWVFLKPIRIRLERFLRIRPEIVPVKLEMDVFKWARSRRRRALACSQRVEAGRSRSPAGLTASGDLGCPLECASGCKGIFYCPRRIGIFAGSIPGRAAGQNQKSQKVATEEEAEFSLKHRFFLSCQRGETKNRSNSYASRDDLGTGAT